MRNTLKLDRDRFDRISKREILFLMKELDNVIVVEDNGSETFVKNIGRVAQ